MKKFLVFMLAMLIQSIAAFSQITISQEDYDRLPKEARTQIEKITTEKTIKGEMSEYANLGREIAVNETLKAVEDSAVRISKSDLGQTAIAIVVWKLLYKEIAGVGTVLLGMSLYLLIVGRGKLSKNSEDAGGWIVSSVVTFISSMFCMFG